MEPAGNNQKGSEGLSKTTITSANIYGNPCEYHKLQPAHPQPPGLMSVSWLAVELRCHRGRTTSVADHVLYPPLGPTRDSSVGSFFTRYCAGFIMLHRVKAQGPANKAAVGFFFAFIVILLSAVASHQAMSLMVGCSSLLLAFSTPPIKQSQRQLSRAIGEPGSV